MAHGLEARSPLLDQEVLEFALGLPDRWLLDGNGGKPLLKALLARFVPPELFQRPKHGFNVPLPVWFAHEATSGWADELADSESLRECRSEEHTSELQSRLHLVCRLLLE